jgi:uncharacterized protein GlcG (DUF336 family)
MRPKRWWAGIWFFMFAGLATSVRPADVVTVRLATLELARDIAEGKANAVVLSGVSTRELAENQADILDELNLLEGVLILRGGVPIRAAGSLIGAIGVSGAPGGDKDEACALKGLESVEERLEFAE